MLLVLHLGALLDDGGEPHLRERGFVHFVDVLPEAHLHGLRLDRRFVQLDAVLCEGLAVSLDALLDEGEGLGVVHRKGVAEVVGEGRGRLGQLRCRVVCDAEVGVESLVADKEALHLRVAAVNGVRVVVRPFPDVCAGEQVIELRGGVLSELRRLYRCAGEFLDGVRGRLDGFDAQEGCERPFDGVLDLVACVAALRAHVIERPLCVLGLILDVVCRVCGPVEGLNEFPLYGLYGMGEGRSYGLCALCDVVLEAGELFLRIGDGPGDAGAEALGKRLSALDARCHRLLEGRAEAVGLRSHFSEAVTRIVPGVVEVRAHPLGGGSGVPCCARACRAHVADCAAARLSPGLCPVYGLIDVAEAAFHLLDGVQGVRRLEAYAIGEVSCVCQVFTSLNAEIAAPEGTAISFCWGSIRLAIASGPRRLPGTLSSPFL